MHTPLGSERVTIFQLYFPVCCPLPPAENLCPHALSFWHYYYYTVATTDPQQKSEISMLSAGEGFAPRASKNRWQQGKVKRGCDLLLHERGKAQKDERTCPSALRVCSRVSCQLICRLYTHNNPSCQQRKQEHQHCAHLQRQAASTTPNNPTEVTQQVTTRTSQQESEIGRAHLPS